MDDLYRVERVSFSYDRLSVLEEIHFSVRRGEFFSIVGPNGGGKTTLLKMLLGLLKPQKGRIIYENQEIEAISPEKFKVGYLPQVTARSRFNSRLLLSVHEVVESGIRNGTKKERKERVEAILETLQIANLARRIFFDLSGGQQQKTLLARALAQNPETLILDEPTTGIDTESRERLLSLLGDLNRHQGMTLILVTHDLSVIPSLSHRVACLNRKLFVHENPSEFASCPVIQEEMASGLELLIHGTSVPHRTVAKHFSGRG